MLDILAQTTTPTTTDPNVQIQLGLVDLVFQFVGIIFSLGVSLITQGLSFVWQSIFSAFTPTT